MEPTNHSSQLPFNRAMAVLLCYDDEGEGNKVQSDLLISSSDEQRIIDDTVGPTTPQSSAATASFQAPEPSQGEDRSFLPPIVPSRSGNEASTVKINQS